MPFLCGVISNEVHRSPTISATPLELHLGIRSDRLHWERETPKASPGLERNRYELGRHIKPQ